MNPTKQFYYCFGCGASGTVLSFLMNYDHLPFVEAVEDLAGRLGVEVPREHSGAGPAAPTVSDDLYAVMGKVATFYAEQLAATERAQAYAAKRGLTTETIATFGIGYAPNAWNEVLKRFGASDASRQKLTETGLIIEREKGDGHYDRFRDRLMFPIRDARGRVIAFGGRVLDQGEPKYLNSPETPLFHKGRELYGLYEVRQKPRPAHQVDRGGGLHGRGPPAAKRHHLCRGHAGHRHHTRASQARLPAGEGNHLLLRPAIAPVVPRHGARCRTRCPKPLPAAS